MYVRDLTDEFKTRLENISTRGSTTDDDVEYVNEFIALLARDEWVDCFGLNVDNIRIYVYQLSRIFHVIGKILEKNWRRCQKDNRLSITMIGHGGINTSLMMPCRLYYPTQFLDTITLYQPWGCAIDANVVYGIATHTLEIRNVRYSGRVLPSYTNSSQHSLPTDWNTLPKTRVDIPAPIFYPLTFNEPALNSLRLLATQLQDEADGLVILYINSIGPVPLPLPQVPLYVISNMVSLWGSLYDLTIDFRFAACLTSPNPSQESGFIGNTIYYSSNLRTQPPDVMTNIFNIPQRVRYLQSGLNLFLRSNP